MKRDGRPIGVLVVAGLMLLPRPSPAVMDITDRGPLLQAGRFTMRVTNIGVLGNAFFNTGLSFDPSFEFPKGSGHELLNHAELWVGAVNETGERRVSGGPMLEWRPTLDSSDVVSIANAGDPGTRPHFDDDGDGRVDEEILNGKDDDGDGRIDEDIRMPAQQMLAADYTDDQPQAVNYAYPNGERHVPLGLAVHQECYAFPLPGHDNIAGIEFTITNHGTQTLHDLYLGLYADLDSRDRRDTAGHTNDLVELVPYHQIVNPRADSLNNGGCFWVKQCADHVDGTAAVVRDGSPRSSLPAVAIVPLTHTTDPLSNLLNDAFPGVREARLQARAPYKDTTFRYSIFANDAPPGEGGPPITDPDRYAALAGTLPQTNTDNPRDYVVLVSCGPFGRLEPGQQLQFSLALVALTSPDSATADAFDARALFAGTRVNTQPDGPRKLYNVGVSGINGHEICLQPPAGVHFNYDPHCPGKIGLDPDLIKDVNVPLCRPSTEATEVTYGPGGCIWTDLDCDLCTGDDGTDEVRHWELDLRLPPAPVVRATPGDHTVTVAWDNSPEQAIAAGRVGAPQFRFAGYKVYRLDDWTRSSALPEPERWQRIGVYRVDPAQGGSPLSDVTDPSIGPDGGDAGGPHYPVGRYRFTDVRALDGFDYLYAVTTILRQVTSPAATVPPLEYESPFFVSFDARVAPHAAARPAAGRVWVVPNPYRAHADWEREPVPGDAFTRHVDFMGLPRTRSTIRIYTLAGDLVQTLDHDGSNGDGEAGWNLISRNGQDIESGVYLFTVSSALGHQVGRFVILR